MDAREKRGLMLAAVAKIERRKGIWIVPSQTGSVTSYLVSLKQRTCTCPDFEGGTPKCKHIWAAEAVARKQREKAEGEESIAPKLTNPKENARGHAEFPRQSETSLFKTLLFDLCRPLATNGLRRIPVNEMMFAAVFKVFSALPAQRFIQEMKVAQDDKYFSRPFCLNSVLRFFYEEEMTEGLHRLIKQSSLPLGEIEANFAEDSIRAPITRLVRWFDVRFGRTYCGSDWLLVDAMTGLQTQIVSSVNVRGRQEDEPPLLGSLRTGRRFVRQDRVATVSSNPLKDSVDNTEELRSAVQLVFEPTNVPGYAGLWDKLLILCKLNRHSLAAHFGRRNASDSVLRTIQGNFKGKVQSKTETAAKNEVLARIVCHNICCVRDAIIELGSGQDKPQPNLARQIVRQAGTMVTSG